MSHGKFLNTHSLSSSSSCVWSECRPLFMASPAHNVSSIMQIRNHKMHSASGNETGGITLSVFRLHVWIPLIIFIWYAVVCCFFFFIQRAMFGRLYSYVLMGGKTRDNQLCFVGGTRTFNCQLSIYHYIPVFFLFHTTLNCCFPRVFSFFTRIVSCEILDRFSVLEWFVRILWTVFNNYSDSRRIAYNFSWKSMNWGQIVLQGKVKLFWL